MVRPRPSLDRLQQPTLGLLRWLRSMSRQLTYSARTQPDRWQWYPHVEMTGGRLAEAQKESAQPHLKWARSSQEWTRHPAAADACARGSRRRWTHPGAGQWCPGSRP